MPASLRARLPEILAVLAVCGIAWRLWPHAEEGPPAQHRCTDPHRADACFLRLEGGRFLQGAQALDPTAPGHDPDALPEEGPPRTVEVGPFWLQQTEATVGQYRACVRAGACSEDEVETGGGYATYRPVTAPDDGDGDAMPVNSLTWRGASDLCAWLGGRLPTETEWEFAARGVAGRRWPWGDQAWCPVPPDTRSRPGQRSGDDQACDQDGPVRATNLPNPTPERVLGMAGNLWEWTADAWAPADGAPPPSSPAGPHRTQRGGGWTATHPREVRGTVRGGMDPTTRLHDVGVRCAAGGAG
ncbi:MAG: SUMF1/EgtB/PvdO family nonheme iron enzyme [Alphaproteobacteria bacterium]|nr:SUMF1/EgtB/PvdO family nonheme iron enzyme [Alphaproteobacteria bacterium]